MIKGPSRPPAWSLLAAAEAEGRSEKTLNRLRYLLDPQEPWARSYAQWIAVKSDDPAQQKAFRDRVRSEGDYNAEWWEDDDFASVAAAIDGLFRKLGWLKR